jgi:hypothetical protein
MLMAKKALELKALELALCDMTHHLAHCDIFHNVTCKEDETDGSARLSSASGTRGSYG